MNVDKRILKLPPFVKKVDLMMKSMFASFNSNAYSYFDSVVLLAYWETLATRRKTARLTFMYKLSHNLTDFSIEAYLKPNNERRTRGSHDFKFVVPWAKKDAFKFSFFPRTITEWNSLPKDTANATSLDSFKFKLNNSF